MLVCSNQLGRNAYAVVVDQCRIRNQKEDGVDNLQGNARGFWPAL
jgi:hypothetical protein